MSEEKKYYCFCGSNCKYETMTKEQILAAIAQATGFDNVDPDAGFITRVKEKNGGNYVTFWVGTQAQYNAIESKETNCMYIITDDTTSADLLATVSNMQSTCKTAAANAASAANAAAASADAARFDVIDITNEIDLAYRANGLKLTVRELCGKQYTYIPKMHMVFFQLTFNFKGAMSKNGDVMFDLVHPSGGEAKYKPREGLVYAAAASHNFLAMGYSHHGVDVRAAEDFDTGDAYLPAVYFSGWYYCDGE